jgi:hypothetical protein
VIGQWTLQILDWSVTAAEGAEDEEERSWITPLRRRGVDRRPPQSCSLYIKAPPLRYTRLALVSVLTSS